MVDEPDSIILQYMRRFDTQLQRMGEDIHEMRIRLTNVEESQSIIHRRLDRMDERLERIECRLDLVGSPYGGVRE
jgi:DNA repair ATPase RecN